MIDLHSHILPGLDDGASDAAISLDMARMFAADGVTTVACTPHILPGLYHNSGPQILQAITKLQNLIDQAGLSLRLVAGADNHIAPDFVAGLRAGHLLTLAGSRYVLVEPPHHTVPARLEQFFFDLQVAGFFPILTHPERLSWINNHYPVMQRLVHSGVWMQLTAGSLTGAFGKSAQYWAERMLDEGLVHILATDAHDAVRRPPILKKGRDLAERRVGAIEADHLVFTRPQGVLVDASPTELPAHIGANAGASGRPEGHGSNPAASQSVGRRQDNASRPGVFGFAGRLRRLLG